MQSPDGLKRTGGRVQRSLMDGDEGEHGTAEPGARTWLRLRAITGYNDMDLRAEPGAGRLAERTGRLFDNG